MMWTQNWSLFILASIKSTGTKEWKLLGKLAHYMKKFIIVLLGVSHRSPPMLFHTISDQIDHFLE